MRIQSAFHAPRAAVLGILLLLTLAVACVLAWEAYQSARSHEQVASGVLRDYAGAAGWEFARRASEALDAAMNASLGPLVHAAEAEATREQSGRDSHAAPPEHPLPLPTMGPGQMIRGSFRIDLERNVIAAATIDIPPAVLSRLLSAARDLAGTLFPEYSRAALVFVGASGERRAFAFMIVDRPACRLAVGFEAGPSFFAHVLERIGATAPLLPESLTRGTRNDALLSLRVIHPPELNDPIYQSSLATSEFKGWHPLDASLGGLVGVVYLRPEAARALVVGGLPRSRLPLLAGLLAVTALLIVAALLQLRREYELSRLRTEFVSCVSHELRTPLAEIRLFGETLLLGRVRSEEERRRGLEIIDKEARRLTQLVENVLLFSRSERGVGRVVVEPASVASIVRGVVETFAPLARARGVRVEVNIPNDDIGAMLDPRAMQQVLINLLDNAVKYGPDGQTVIIAVSEDAGLVRIEVRDQGPGVPREDRERVWQPFARARRERASGIAGTGIGLAVVRELCRLQNGSARLEDDDGPGARFVVELPGTGVGAAHHDQAATT